MLERGGVPAGVALGVACLLAVGAIATPGATEAAAAAGGGATDGPRSTVRGRVQAADPAVGAHQGSGTVRFAGSPPAGQPIDMSADRYCSEQHPTPVVESPVEVGADGGLAGVLVHVTNAPAGDTGATPTDDPVLDQLGCLYAPRAIAVRTGQAFVVRNSDQTLHNVRVGPSANRGFNLAQPMRGMESRRAFDDPEIGIPVRCDIHGWMTSTIHVLDHGFYAISGEDGSFDLPDLPPGEYGVEAWHATLGTSSQTITVAAGSPVEIAFELGG